MSVQSEINRINANIARAYDAVQTMGGTLPVTQNTANLPAAIATLAQSDYIQLEWVESTGSQYINTGINANTVGKIQTKFKSVNANNSTWRSVLYCEDPGGSYPGLGIRINDSNKLQFNYCSSYVPVSSTVTPDSSEAANTWYDTELNGLNNIVTINNTVYNNTFSGSLPDGNIYVFATEYESAANQYSGIRISYLKIYNLSNELVRDFIPVLRKTDYEVGLYDKVNNQFYGNLGLGSLRPGIKIAGYSIVDNIQGGGSAYFDTGVSGGSKMEYSLYLNTMGTKAHNYQQYFSGSQTPASHKIYLNGTSNTSPIFAQQASGNNWVAAGGTLYNQTNLILYNNTSAKHTISFYSDGKIYLDNTLWATGANNGWGSLSYYLFRGNEETTISNMAVFQLVMKTDGNVVRFYIPTKRASDNKYGFYDLVNNTFSPSASNTAFTAGSVSISNDGTNSPYYSIPVVVPSPSAYTGSIANQIARINENVSNAYDVCRQIGRTMPLVENSYYLEPTILDLICTVVWKNYDGTVLYTEKYIKGETPIYKGITPHRQGDSNNVYVLTGWSPSVAQLTGDTEYIAQFTLTPFSTNLYYKIDNGTLYLRNDNQTGYSDGTSALTSTGSNSVPWIWSAYENVNIENQIIPKSCNHWFTGTLNAMNHTNFYNMSNLITSGVTDMSYMFRQSKTNGGRINLDISSFDTAEVTNMEYMFMGNLGVRSLDLRNFDTSKVTTMKEMFGGRQNLWGTLNVSSFNTHNVTNMTNMFANLRSLPNLDLSNFDFTNVVYANWMCMHCESVKSLSFSNYNSNSVNKEMQNFVSYCNALTYLDLSGFDMATISTTTTLFAHCPNVTTAYCRTQADKAILDQLVADAGYSWRFTVKS